MRVRMTASKYCHYFTIGIITDTSTMILRSVFIVRKRATVITTEHEEQLWRLGVLGKHSPSALLNVFIFAECKSMST